MMRNVNRDLFFSILYFLRLSILLHVIFISADELPYIPSDHIVLNCGASSSVQYSNGRNWSSDIDSRFINFTPRNASTTSKAPPNENHSIPEIPYMTARIFHSQFTYSFPIIGRKIIRFYFYPASYSGLNANRAVFSITAGRYTLLRNFSAFDTAEGLKSAFFIKEFSVDTENEMFLNVTFTPSSDTSSFYYAFVNGIEVVSMPSDLYNREDVALIAGQQHFIGLPDQLLNNSTVLEMLYRLNVGGDDISPQDDTGMFRTWNNDSPYIIGSTVGQTFASHSLASIKYPIPAYAAPRILYTTTRSGSADMNSNSSLVWRFPIDSGFNYLVRLHFCEIDNTITRNNLRVFQVLINSLEAEDYRSNGLGVPVYKDYLLMVPKGRRVTQNLQVALYPKIESDSMYHDPILNGLEIFKLNNNNLAKPGTLPNEPEALPYQPVLDPIPPEPFSRPSENLAGRTLMFIVGGTFVGTVVLFLFCFFLFRQRRGRSVESRLTKSQSKSKDLCRHFSFDEIKAATNNFSEAQLIGVGGFGKVYKGYIDCGATMVAIKRGNPMSQQGTHEFQTEIKMLSKLRHLHLVSFTGFCEEGGEMILVYEHMAKGTLRDHLYKTQNPSLLWKQRLKICIGAARGLHYLHTGSKNTIIHRDVKTTNILLDEKWVAKVSDFGLSKVGPATVSHTHISTVVKGSFGYLDPEYYRRQKLTEKSDVYSFGVVLFEVLSARPAVNPMAEEEQMSLAEWALRCHQTGTMDQIIDPSLRGKIVPDCFIKFTEIAVKCLADWGIERPSMADVLWNLELALQLQNSSEVEESMGGEPQNERGDKIDGMTAGGRNPCRDNSDKTLGAEFSELMVLVGR